MQARHPTAIATATSRRLRLVTATDRRHPLDRTDALRRVRAAQRTLAPRAERFAHLTRMHD